jgi:threonine dehydratase
MTIPTPLEQAPADLAPGRRVYLKREDVHELGAFKWRGALPAMERYTADGAEGVVTASTGNHGAATAWAAARLGLTATIYIPAEASRTKLEHLTRLGADVVQIGADLDEAKERAEAHARATGLPFFEDGAEPAQLEGYGAIGAEILDQLDEAPDAVVCPVGNGALFAGLGRVLAERAANVRRIGVVPKEAPVMALSWGARKPVASDRCDTIADGLAVRVAIPIAVEWLVETADAMVQVSEREIARAVAAYDEAGIRAEPAAAAALAALSQVAADGAVVLIVTGRNIDDELLACCHRDSERFPD